MGGGSRRKRREEREKIPSGAIHAGEYIRPGHWKENLASAMLILAVMSSSICKLITSASSNIWRVNESQDHLSRV